jgi:hypothetical protein
MTTASQNKKFDRILHLDLAHRGSWTQAVYGQGNPVSLEADKRRFYDALDALTPDEIVAFRAYRKMIREGE